MFDIQTELDLKNMKKLSNEEGKNSEVYLATDIQLDNEFVVKKISKESIFKDYGTKDESNLFNESKILYKVSHPNITDIQYASYDEDNVYMVMPFYKNGSLQSLIEKRNLTVREVIKYSLDFLAGLLHVHANQLVHFDIKPTNVLINNNGKGVLTDFGLAKYIDPITELAQPIKLYYSHKPPEYFMSRLLSKQADIYQAGVTMYRLANGNNIWCTQASWFTYADIIDGNFPDRKFYLPHIPKKLSKVINKCMDVNVDKRYSTVLEIINALSTIEGNLDWVYKEVDEKTQIWENICNGMCTKISLVFDGKMYNLNGTKTNQETGNSTNISKLSKKKITLDEAYKVIATFIEE